MLNLSIFLEDSARSYPDRDAIVAGGQRLSYAQVEARANQVANLLISRGITAGDKVALACPNLPWFPVIYYGILKTGAVVVPLNVSLKGREIAYHLQDSEATAFFCYEGSPELPTAAEGAVGLRQTGTCRHFFVIPAGTTDSATTSDGEPLAQALEGQSDHFDSAPTESTDTAVILYTSGTTGTPKGAELTHANLVLNALTAHRLIGSTDAVDTHLIALPLFHSFGQTLQMHTAFAAGATVILMPRFEPHTAATILATQSVTHFAGVPTMWHGLLAVLQQTDQLAQVAANLKLALSGGAAMPVELQRQIQEKLGVKVLEGYGLSETSPAVCFTPRDGQNRTGSIGKPIWGVEMKLIDNDWSPTPQDPDAIGEIAVKGHPVMKGYYNRPDATAAAIRDGWFRTGDLARRDADGYYYVIDRAKEMIIRGGYNVYPRELEEILLTHPAVSMVAVIGVPDEKYGEEVKAFIVPVAGSNPTSAEIIGWGKTQFAGYKYPRFVEIVDQLPTSATGKILKRQLKGAAQ